MFSHCACPTRIEFNSLSAPSEAAGVVSTARMERPPFYRGGSASTETISTVSPSPLFRERKTNVGVLPFPFITHIPI